MIKSYLIAFAVRLPTSYTDHDLRDGPLENLWGGGGAGQVPKKYPRKGKLNAKNSCTPINPKKYSCYGLKIFIQGI